MLDSTKALRIVSFSSFLLPFGQLLVRQVLHLVPHWMCVTYVRVRALPWANGFCRGANCFENKLPLGKKNVALLYSMLVRHAITFFN